MQELVNGLAIDPCISIHGKAQRASRAASHARANFRRAASFSLVDRFEMALRGLRHNIEARRHGGAVVGAH
jgi:hypothetical protein